MSSILRTISWMLLALVALLTLLSALGSAWFALSRQEDVFGSVSMADLTRGDQSLADLLHARRLTAAAYAAGYAVLFFVISIYPYRRGDVWAWWAVLLAGVVSSGLTLLRVPLLGVGLGASVGALQLAVVVLALLLDIRRLRRSSST